MKYRVLIPEVCISHRIVEASTPEEAKNLAENMETEEDYEYSHTLDRETWLVEKEPE